MNDELLQLRKLIDQLDEDILARLSERARHAQRVGEVKKGNLYRPEREAQVLRRLAELNPGPLSDQSVKTIFREIMSACLALESPLKVAYLGPAGTFSESAARKHFGSAPSFIPQASIDEVFRATEAGVVDYGVVPVENSTEGVVGATLDLLLTNPLRVCGEVQLRIQQHLLSRAEGIGALKRIYSHSQSLAQCNGWLSHNLAHLPRIPVASNAEAARMAAEDPESAAIAGEAAAELFMTEQSGVQVPVATSGTGGGFEKFCHGETDISNASREIKPEEAERMRDRHPATRIAVIPGAGHDAHLDNTQAVYGEMAHYLRDLQQ